MAYQWRSRAKFGARFLNYLLWLILPVQIQSYPIHPRTADPIPVDPSSDAWAETLSGIGPLILLIGERSTKQHIRSVRHIYSALSIGAAPLGLLAVISSLVRLCGIQKLRAFIGYELEARTVAGIDYTQVNCGGLHAEIVDGHIVRSTSANPSSQAVAVSYLRGSMEELVEDAMRQISACTVFENDMRSQGIPTNAANLQWVLQLLCADATNESMASVVNSLVESLGLGEKSRVDMRVETFIGALRDNLARHTAASDGEYKDQGAIEGGIENALIPQTSDQSYDKAHVETKSSNSTDKTILQVQEVSSNLSERDSDEKYAARTMIDVKAMKHQPNNVGVNSPQLVFMYTLDAVSEFLTSRPASKFAAFQISILSLASILAIYTIALWQLDWEFSVGWLLAVMGYVGIVTGVTAAAMIISSSCKIVALENQSATSKAGWVDGVVNSVKNTDSMDTVGSEFKSSQFGPQILEVVWMKPLTQERALLASGMSVALVAFFICHYLGLRSSKWWVAVGELGVCLLAAFARSITKGRHELFETVPGTKIDKRCLSTGIITTQKGNKVSTRTWRNLDARAYSPVSVSDIPTDGESIAWRVARLCIDDAALVSQVMAWTGMVVHAVVTTAQNGHDSSAVLVSFDGGLVVTEGLAFPNTRVCLSFHTSLCGLGMPTGLLARGIMRQPEWVLDKPGFGPFPLGEVYVFGMTNIIDWWTVSEDRNGMDDLSKNLQWAFMLINVAFFIALLKLERDEGLPPLAEIDKVHQMSGQRNIKVGQKVYDFLQLRAMRI